MGSRLEKNSDAVRKRIASHTFDGEDGDEYGGSKFGGFPEYFRRKKIKLQNLDAEMRSQAGDKPQIFKGIVAHVNGYTQPSLNDLHTLIVQHGGGFMQYLDGKTTVTHIIASSLTPKKAVEFRKYRIVKPAWVVHSIAAGKLLPWNDYRVVDEGEKQNVLAFDKGKVLSQANIKSRGYRDQTDASWYTGQLQGTHSGPSGTPTSSSSSNNIRSRFSKTRLPTPDDAIEDQPPSRQPMSATTETFSREAKRPEKFITPPKTSPLVDPEESTDYVAHSLGKADGSHDSLYADPTPPPIHQLEPNIDADDKEETADPAQATVPDRPLTAEEHNAILLSDPKIRQSTVVDPKFLEQYYRESRLHHLSTWKADLKSQLQALAGEKSLSQKSKQKRPAGARRYILHVDFDSFFVAVSLKKQPQYKDKPAVVAHGQGSGSEIASCNYPARKFGVKNGMWMKKALDMCPDLKILPYDFPAYEETSRAFYDAILATDGIVQSVSVDEALVDISNLCVAAGGSDGRQVSEGSIYREQTKADEIARSLRDQVRAKTSCEVSIGIGGNILLAKLALRKAKPAGQHQIKPEEVLDFIAELQAQDLPGVAWSIGGKLEEIGVKFIKDIRELSKERLIQALGPKTGEKLWEYSRGIDRQEVGEQVIRKSVSAEVNWGVRFENQEQVEEFIASLCGELQKRLLKEKVKGKQFTMKIMRRSPTAPLDPPKHLGHGECDTHNKSLVLGIATNSKEVLTKEALSMLRGFGFTPGELRGIGLQMTKLEIMKSATNGNFESSQRRLHFKTGNTDNNNTRKTQKVVKEDPIQDDPETPRKPTLSTTDEHIAFGPTELNQSTPSRRPLNMMGTQFIMPTQVDSQVLAELPEDIRSKLLRQHRATSPTPATPTKQPSFALTALPPQSQLNSDTLAELPPTVRAEILAQYNSTTTLSSPSRRPRHTDQTLLPQSPRKNRIIGIPAKRPIAPVKRGRGRPPRSAMLAAAAQMPAVTKAGKRLTQANFIQLKNPARDGNTSRSVSADPAPIAATEQPVTALSDAAKPTKSRDATRPASDDLDPSFLAALPEDLRAEVLAQHTASRLRASRLQLHRPHLPLPHTAHRVPPTAQVKKIPRPKLPSFTGRRLRREGEIRQAVREWVGEFWSEGPYREDVGALGGYLGRVVRVGTVTGNGRGAKGPDTDGKAGEKGEGGMEGEGNLGKAVGLVKWCAWVVGEEKCKEREGGGEEKGTFAMKEWDDAVQVLKDAVRQAARERGMGDVSFD